MNMTTTDRRNFLIKGAGSLVAAAAGSSIVLSTIRSSAAERNPPTDQKTNPDGIQKRVPSRVPNDPEKEGAPPMIAVLFEVWPKEEGKQEYLDTAANLRAMLDGIDGFISIERFESLYEPGKILSLSFWRDEAAIEKWRRLEAHRQAQAMGRSGIFENYRIRVSGVVRDYGMSDRNGAPEDSKDFHG
jgi:heme-degrading monooxygenase HmoA